MNADYLETTSKSAARTRVIGSRLGELAFPGDVILLMGELGTGKTCLTQGIARGLGIDEYASSPSFVLVREYHGRLPLYHMDLYRLERIEDVFHLGLDDYLYGNGVCVVEWAEKGLGALPLEHLLVKMEHLTTTKRKLSFSPQGSRYVEMLSRLRLGKKVARK